MGLIFRLLLFTRILVSCPGGISSKYINGERTKVLLLWSPKDHVPLASLRIGDAAFTDGECKITNCWVTSDRAYFDGGDLSRFDAIAFSGHNLDNTNDLPPYRYPHQKYIFFSSESASQRPICNKKFDNFFNWTATYRLDSDIPWPYFYITGTVGNQVKVIGPRKNIQWRHKYQKVSKEVLKKIKNKRKAVAWFTGNMCRSSSGREDYAIRLHIELQKLGSGVDVYGGCGTIKCPSVQTCFEKLNNDYFFYLAMEPFLDNDFVTQELLIAVSHHIVPIVFGSANYSRFLPPHSYLEANEDPKETAHTIVDLMKYPDRYNQYFRWKKYYSYRLPRNYCRLCAALNMKRMINDITIYKDFRQWWYPNYESQCKWYIFANRVKEYLG